jgi:hypothetical protein
VHCGTHHMLSAAAAAAGGTRSDSAVVSRIAELKQSHPSNLAMKHFDIECVHDLFPPLYFEATSYLRCPACAFLVN